MNTALNDYTAFTRHLRNGGLPVTPTDSADLLRVLPMLQSGHPHDFREVARALFTQSPEQSRRLDELIASFESMERSTPPTATLGVPETGPTHNKKSSPSSTIETESEQAAALAFSASERLQKKDFSEMTPAEIEAARAWIQQLSFRLPPRLSRRWQPGRGRLLDLRRSLRRQVRHGGEVFRWDQRERREEERPLIVLADISGSMEVYSRLLLPFVHQLSRAREALTEAFVFSTRLTRITTDLENRALEAALLKIANTVPDWSGGTRIGEALARFRKQWAGRILRGKSIVLLVTDGWDRGAPEQFGFEMERLKRRCHRLIWMNPLLGLPGYEPLTRGVQAALPHVDAFRPAHNLESLSRLTTELETS
jgi:uncharacterized protein with von Willebrand factor type A (vWA) domain